MGTWSIHPNNQYNFQISNYSESVSLVTCGLNNSTERFSKAKVCWPYLELVVFSDKIDQWDLIAIYRAFHPKTEEYTFFSSSHGTFSRIYHMVGHKRIGALELWCWRRLLRVPWTVRRSNQSILMEINPECSLEGLMLKLKLQYFGHLMGRTDSLERVWKDHGKNWLFPYTTLFRSQFSLSVMSNSLQTQGLQHTRLPCPSPTPRAYSNSCPLSQWLHYL